jgi:1-acyl-sn-glycerol-3-phosphate acyltransferase
MLTTLRSILFLPIFYGLSTPIVIITFLVAIVSRRGLRWCAHVWGGFHYLCARLILGIRVRIDGQLHNDHKLYVFKHESMFETIDLLRIFANPVVIAKKELLRIPLWGWAARRHGLIGIDRDGGAAAMRQIIREAVAAKAQNRPIVIFAEGSRAHHGERPPLQTGFAGLYRLLNLPIVPVAVNSGKLAPRDTIVRHSGTITYQVQAEIPPGLDRDEVRDRVHAAINALNS